MDTGNGASVHAVGNALAGFCDDRVWQWVSSSRFVTLLYHFCRRPILVQNNLIRIGVPIGVYNFGKSSYTEKRVE
jgi:hypothetical protein